MRNYKDNRLANEALEAIENYNRNNDNIKNTSSLLLSTFQDPDGDDCNHRIEAVNCASRINNSIFELSILDGYTMDNPMKKNNKEEKKIDIKKWLDIKEINLFDYVPGKIDKIQNTSGTEFSNLAKDFNIIHKSLKKYNPDVRRGNHLLVNEDFFYDDSYLMQRTVFGPKGEMETNTSPILPTLEDFEGLIFKDQQNENTLIELVGTFFRIIDTEIIKLPDFITNCSYNQIINGLHFKDVEESIDYANYILANAPKNIYFVADNGEYMIVQLSSKELKKHPASLINSYKNNFDNASDIVKFYIYNNDDYAKYYHNYKYEAVLNYKILYSNLSELDTPCTPVNDIKDIDYIKCCNEQKNKCISAIKKCLDGLKSFDENAFCDYLNPVEHYEEFYNHLTTYPTDTVEQCDSLIIYCLSNISPWLNERSELLIDYTTDENNISKMLNILENRLTKNTGSLLIWYQSLLQSDDLCKSVESFSRIANNYTSKYLVTRAYNDVSGNNATFNTIPHPNFIDIEDLDPLYNGQSFKMGDQITILDSIFNDHVNTIIGFDKINIETIDYVDENLKIIKKIIPVTRLILKNKIPGWCNIKDPSNILIMKKVN